LLSIDFWYQLLLLSIKGPIVYYIPRGAGIGFRQGYNFKTISPFLGDKFFTSKKPEGVKFYDTAMAVYTNRFYNRIQLIKENFSMVVLKVTVGIKAETNYSSSREQILPGLMSPLYQMMQ